jgi:hypothetical protein
MPRIYLSNRALLVRPHCRTVDYQHRYASHNYSLFTINYSLFTITPLPCSLLLRGL